MNITAFRSYQKPTSISILAFFLVSTLLLQGCSQSNSLSGREKGAIGGGVLGAGAGAIIGRATGNTGAGIAIGGGLGALSGALIGNESDTQDRRYQEQDERLRRQEEEIRRQRREVQELRGTPRDRGYYDDRYYDRPANDPYYYDNRRDSYRY